MEAFHANADEALEMSLLRKGKVPWEWYKPSAFNAVMKNTDSVEVERKEKKRKEKGKMKHEM
jgi:hypothetical protein